MKSVEQIEQSIRRLHLDVGAEERKRTLSELVKAHEKHQQEEPAPGWRDFGRIIMRRKPLRIAAVAALGVVLAGTLTLGGGSVAFSQVGDTVSSTLARLKEMVIGIRAWEHGEQMPVPALPPTAGTEEQEPVMEKDPAMALTAVSGRMQFWASRSETNVARLLHEQRIDLVPAGTNPNIAFAVLGPETVESLASRLASTEGIRLVTSPRIVVGSGGEGMVGSQVLALAWQPTVVSDGNQIEVNLAVHNGEDGFELPTLCIEIGEALLIHATDIAIPAEGNTDESAASASSTLLILIRIEVW